MLTSGAGAVVPLTQLQSLIQDMLTSGAGAVVPVTQLQADLYSFLVGIAGVAPMSDVIALIQDMLTSVAGAVVPVTQLQSELAFFLFGITGVEPVVDAGDVSTVLRCRRPCMRGWRRNCRGVGRLPVSRVCRWPTSQPGLHRSGGLRRPFSPR